MKPFPGSLAFAALAIICSYPKVVQMKMTRLFSLGTRANFIIIDYVPLQFLALVPFSLIGFCSSQSQTLFTSCSLIPSCLPLWQKYGTASGLLMTMDYCLDKTTAVKVMYSGLGFTPPTWQIQVDFLQLTNWFPCFHILKKMKVSFPLWRIISTWKLFFILTRRMDSSEGGKWVLISALTRCIRIKHEGEIEREKALTVETLKRNPSYYYSCQELTEW